MFLNGYPYTDFHEMNADFVLKTVTALQKAFTDFTASNSLIFAEPLLHDLTKSYAKNTIVLDYDGNAYISIQAVPAGVQLSNSDYWLMVFNFEDYTEKANKNFTVNYFRDTTRAPYALAVGDWLILDDVLYKVTVAIAADDLFEVDTNIVHFTIEQFLKDFTTSIIQTVNQYKNDIDASELAYRNQLAQDIADTTATLSAQLAAAISGVTVDSEVIDARVGADGNTYSTLGDAIRGQLSTKQREIGILSSDQLADALFYAEGNLLDVDKNTDSSDITVNGILTTNANRTVSDFIPVNEGDVLKFYCIGSGDSVVTFASYTVATFDENLDVVAEGTTERVSTFTVPSGVRYVRISYFASTNSPMILRNVDSAPTEYVDYTRQSVRPDFVNELYAPGEMVTGTNYNGYYIRSNPDGIATADERYNVRQYEITKDTVYIISGFTVAINASNPIAAIGSATVDTRPSVTPILTGSNVRSDYYMKFRPSKNGYLYIAWVEGKQELNVYEASLFNEIMVSKPSLKIQLFGDSITDNQWGDQFTWANYIEQNLPEYNITVVNDAVGGSGLGHGKSTTTSSHQEDEWNFVHDLVTDGSTLQTDADYIVILAGTNNWKGNYPIGTMADTTVGSVYGDLRSIMEYISEHSAATVFVCTIPQRYNEDDQERPTNEYGEPLYNNLTLAQYCEPFIKVAAFYGMPCINLNAELGFNRINIDNFTVDGLHPNLAGDRKLSSFICGKMKEHFGRVI